MTLSRIETNFRSVCINMNKCVPRPATFIQNPELGKKLRRFNAVLEDLRLEKKAIEQDIQKWKTSRLYTSSKDSHRDIAVVNSKNSTRKAAMAVLNLLGKIFCGGGLTSATVAHVLLKVHAITAGAAMVPTLGGVAILAIGAIMLKASSVLKNIKVSREARLHTSENFKDFLINVVKIESPESAWSQSGQDLLNPELHKIYKRYKAAVHSLPRIKL